MTARWTQRNPQLTWLAAVATLLFVDQVSKSFFSTTLEPGEAVQVTEWLNSVHVLNTGAAFSLLADAGGWQRWFFLAIGLLAVVLILYFLSKHAGEKLFSFALACILGGAIGNLVDRSMHGYVVDFLDFHFKWLAPAFHQGHFPTFNVADAAISLGAFCLILDELLRVKRSK